MGCWYSTCFMSNLPIMPGDDITIIVLAPKRPGDRPGMTCYPNERYEPIGFPIFAEYDDDVRVRSVRDMNEYMFRYLHEFTTVYEKHRYVTNEGKEDHKFIEYEWDDIEEFLRDVIHGELWVECVDGEKRQLEHVMVHTKLYLALIKNVANRIPYGKTETYEDLMHYKVLKTVEWLKEEDDFEAVMRLKYGIDAPCLRKFTDKVCVDTFSYWKSLNRFASYYLETEDGYILDQIVNYILWSTVMDHSRKGYHCISGAGSQCQEMMLQKIIAEYIIAKCTEMEAEYDYEGNVLEEDFYFWYD